MNTLAICAGRGVHGAAKSAAAPSAWEETGQGQGDREAVTVQANIIQLRAQGSGKCTLVGF